MDTIVLNHPIDNHKSLLEQFNPDEYQGNEDKKQDCPPRQLLQYLVRMGSFTSVPAVREDSQDLDFVVPVQTTRESLINRCLSELPLRCKPLTRQFVNVLEEKKIDENDDLSISLQGDQLHSLSFFREDFGNLTEATTWKNDVNEGRFRILTWNILAQALAVGHDNFVGLPEGTLDWNTRRLNILHEIIAYDPDIICLQEVDHFNFLKSSLKPLGYKGLFCSKPDSPCIYTENNNGPDGCALFYRQSKLDLVSASSRVIEIWKIQSNQVCILANFLLRDFPGQQISIATTHLKARHGGLLPTMRNEQGKDLSNFLNSCGVTSKPLIICGDFNAEPTEPVVATIKKRLEVESAYTNLYKGEEPPFTTWKIRNDGEYCHTLDYIFHNKYCNVESVLSIPTADQIGPTRLPNLNYPSDHIAIGCDIRIKNI